MKLYKHAERSEIRIACAIKGGRSAKDIWDLDECNIEPTPAGGFYIQSTPTEGFGVTAAELMIARRVLDLLRLGDL